MSSRQQRRADERRAAKEDQIRTRVHSQVTAARSVREMWNTYHANLLKPHLGDDESVLWPLRDAFYGGCASMLELMLRVAPEDVSEEAGADMLQRLEDELTTFARGLR